MFKRYVNLMEMIINRNPYIKAKTVFFAQMFKKSLEMRVFSNNSVKIMIFVKIKKFGSFPTTFVNIILTSDQVYFSPL